MRLKKYCTVPYGLTNFGDFKFFARSLKIRPLKNVDFKILAMIINQINKKIGFNLPTIFLKRLTHIAQILHVYLPTACGQILIVSL